ncbi:hypothetical protein [Ralstonia flatus]|nr:hypothetical protein [Ralstonia sp. LMG 32965]MBN6208548.1 hypothetical protein [Ralstonia pickettii]
MKMGDVPVGAFKGVGTSPDTTWTKAFDIPLKARYVQTDNGITPGAANSAATFTLTYQ